MNFPFRLGTTSYIYPDDILPNVRQLAGVVQDVELVLFETDDDRANLPAPPRVAELNALARDHDLTFTVHLPLDLKFDDARSFEKIFRAREATRALEPYAYILHLDGRALQADPTPARVRAWQAKMNVALDKILMRVEPQQLCIENLETWSPEYFAELVADRDLARCVDIGHFWKQARDPLPHLQEHLARTRVIHLHGVGERDHQSLVRQPRAQVQRALEFLRGADYRGVLTLEVFNLDDFLSSRKVLEELWSSDSRS